MKFGTISTPTLLSTAIKSAAHPCLCCTAISLLANNDYLTSLDSSKCSRRIQKRMASFAMWQSIGYCPSSAITIKFGVLPRTDRMRRRKARCMRSPSAHSFSQLNKAGDHTSDPHSSPGRTSESKSWHSLGGEKIRSCKALNRMKCVVLAASPARCLAAVPTPVKAFNSVPK